MNSLCLTVDLGLLSSALSTPGSQTFRLELESTPAALPVLRPSNHTTGFSGLKFADGRWSDFSAFIRLGANTRQ